nr:MAG TPA: hypothetical protein [Caudoviricetes sp.]
MTKFINLILPRVIYVREVKTLPNDIFVRDAHFIIILQ